MSESVCIHCDNQVRLHIEKLCARINELRSRLTELEKSFTDYDPENDDENDVEEDTSQITTNSDDKDMPSISSSSEDEDKVADENCNEDNGSPQYTAKVLQIIVDKAQKISYIRYITRYPNIMKYVQNEDQSTIHQTCPGADLQPFMKKYVNEEYSRKLLKRVKDEVREVHRRYLRLIKND
ncbi:unnamed protein product [Didymodactylos carnosus]|uniref:Uncharacterized protein n=1 Tax=Didymodactylos carnosus TaxID=1234261 RepID=A0A815KS44_9BILA|nr:unnamed protein product [Didymodactylos carnosus]CAF1399524.1 unnamed protein product [Didymodactylos carnosus]CAF3938383.1 unnamed protein product [Didymodactylos carnosus]CAF4293473.1 unnamed protein product [Didymodactylos carnosus]